jgi:hypothetical protein
MHCRLLGFVVEALVLPNNFKAMSIVSAENFSMNGKANTSWETSLGLATALLRKQILDFPTNVIQKYSLFVTTLMKKRKIIQKNAFHNIIGNSLSPSFCLFDFTPISRPLSLIDIYA